MSNKPLIENPLFDTGAGVQYVVLSEKKLTPDETLRAVVWARDRMKKKPKQGTTYSFIVGPEFFE